MKATGPDRIIDGDIAALLDLPPAGVTLWLHLVTPTGPERREAILLPYQEPLLEWRCEEPSIKPDGDGVWQVSSAVTT